MDDDSRSSVPLGNRFYSASPIADASYDNAGDADLSLSELSLTDKPEPGPSRQPFSLLAKGALVPEAQPVEEARDNIDEEHDPSEDNAEAQNRSTAKAREERLTQDLFVLRKLNAEFSVYNNALHQARSARDRVAEQLQQTDALVNKYINIMAKSEDMIGLIFDERWYGADKDEAVLEQRTREAAEKARREAEEKALAAQRERERIEKEERERREQEEKERMQAEKREKMAARVGYGGVRGVRGTRASMRGMRASGIARAASTRGRSPSSASNSSVPRPTSRPASSASVRPPSALTGRSNAK